MEFLSALEDELNNVDKTANGAKSYKSTNSSLVDLFGSISASRNNISIIDTFTKACEEDLETAIRILFNSRDVRGGQGERQVFRILFSYLSHTHPQLVLDLLPLVPEYGRWDDLWHLLESHLRSSVLTLACAQLQKDCDTDQPSLLGKWMPSCNASSKVTKFQAKHFMKFLGMKEKEYRKLLSGLRNKIDIVESKICAKDWNSIDYSKLPSRAGLVHRKTFTKFDYDRYSKYVASLCVLENKINADTLYPYDIVKQILSIEYSNISEIENGLFNAMWNNLPNYMEDKPFQGVVVADVSGSMHCNDKLPLAVSISLAMYIAEKNHGPWANKFITFSENPQVQSIEGSNIYEKVKNLSSADWGMNTDLIAVFESILSTATSNNIPQKDMPKKVIIVSDMQFDMACTSNKRTNLEQIQKKYSKSGYNLPEIVFWNVCATPGSFPMKIHDTGTCLVSGCSPTVLKSVLQDKVIVPSDVMKDTVFTDRYDPVGKVVENYLT